MFIECDNGKMIHPDSVSSLNVLGRKLFGNNGVDSFLIREFDSLIEIEDYCSQICVQVSEVAKLDANRVVFKQMTEMFEENFSSPGAEPRTTLISMDQIIALHIIEFSERLCRDTLTRLFNHGIIYEISPDKYGIPDTPPFKAIENMLDKMYAEHGSGSPKRIGDFISDMKYKSSLMPKYPHIWYLTLADSLEQLGYIERGIRDKSYRDVYPVECYWVLKRMDKKSNGKYVGLNTVWKKIQDIAKVSFPNLPPYDEVKTDV